MIGLVFLIGGMSSDLLIPLFIGEIVDYLAAEEWDRVGTACLYMLGVIFVGTIITSLSYVLPFTFVLVLWNLCWCSCRYIQCPK